MSVGGRDDSGRESGMGLEAKSVHAWRRVQGSCNEGPSAYTIRCDGTASCSRRDPALSFHRTSRVAALMLISSHARRPWFHSVDQNYGLLLCNFLSLFCLFLNKHFLAAGGLEYQNTDSLAYFSLNLTSFIVRE